MTYLPVLVLHDGIAVVRDDLVGGGTKATCLDEALRGHHHIVYASPRFGGAQVAIAVSARKVGARATIFCAAARQPHLRTLCAQRLGAQIKTVRPGYLSVVTRRARDYARQHNALLLQFGATSETLVTAIARRANAVWREYGPFDEVWCAGGSGTLLAGLHRGMRDLIRTPHFHVVQVGKPLKCPSEVTVHVHPLPFEIASEEPCPFPSDPHYERKAWETCRQLKRGQRILFWNVMGECY